MRCILQDKYILKSGSDACYIALPGLMDAIDNYNNAKAADAKVITVGKTPSLVRQYQLLTPYIHFVNDEDGSEYKPPARGQGRRKPVDKVEIIPSTEPAMQFNDVRNDPYFVIQ